MQRKKRYLSGVEELVLLAIANLDGDAYGVTIQQKVRDCQGPEMSTGAVYTTLERLEGKQFVSTWMGEPEQARGGRAKRFYAVNDAGVQALKQAEQARCLLRAETGSQSAYS